MVEQQGIIRSIVDCGSIVQVFIETEDGTHVLAADGRMWRAAVEAIGKTSLAGVRIEFEFTTEWSGGIAWFSIIEDGYVVCPNCRKHIPPHLSPDFCAWGLHRRKTPPPTNGAHADE